MKLNVILKLSVVSIILAFSLVLLNLLFIKVVGYPLNQGSIILIAGIVLGISSIILILPYFDKE